MNNSSLTSLSTSALSDLRAQHWTAVCQARRVRDGLRKTTPLSGSTESTQAELAYKAADAAFEAVISEQRNRNFAARKAAKTE